MSQQQKTNSSESLVSSHLVLLDEAKLDVGRYVNQEKTQAAPTYAFLIVHADIMEALGLPPDVPCTYSQFRVYFGLMDAAHNYKMRLFVVPVDDDGADVFPVDSDGNECVYDFNLPCPATCDVDSPLYYERFIKRT